MSLSIVDNMGLNGGADSYIDVADAIAFLERIDITSPGITEGNLLLSMMYLDGHDYCGVKVSDNQPKDFPRMGSSLTPIGSLKKIGNIQALTAYYISTGQLGIDQSVDPKESAVAMKKVDVLETRYFKSSNMETADFYDKFPLLSQMMHDVICENGSYNGSGSAGILHRA